MKEFEMTPSSLEELILADEAEAAADREGPEEAQRRAGQPHLIFSLAGRKYAVPTAKLEELGYVPKITRVPGLPNWLRGVTVWRGQIIPVVDLRAFLGQEPDQSGRMIVAQARIGLIVDQINTILELSEDQLREPSRDDSLLPHLRGACEHRGELIAALDLDSLLSSAKLQQFDAV